MNALNTAVMAETAAEIEAQVETHLVEQFRARIEGPLAVVASGGSFSAAVLWAHLHESAGYPAWPMTPYAFRQRTVPAATRVLLLSAGGHHHDILGCAALATQRGYDTRAVCRAASPLAALVAAAGSREDVLAMPMTRHADGMIAVHALVALAVLAARAYSQAAAAEGGGGLGSSPASWQALCQAPPPASSSASWAASFAVDAAPIVGPITELVPAQMPRFVIALGAGAAEAAAVDFANKCQETGLAPAWQTDVRHFAHGQFMMLHGGRRDMLLLAFACGSQRAYLDRFAGTISPATVVRRIEVDSEGAPAALALLARGMRTFEELAARAGGQPTIASLPAWGRALYELEV